MSEPQSLIVEKSGMIVTLTINRPASRNPLAEPGDGARFAEAAARVNADPEVRCVILTGAGTAFSAGGNLKTMRDPAGPFAAPGVQIREYYRANVHRMVRALWDIEVPMIAAVNGPAIGLGNDVACLADVRIAADTAVFGATFLRVGLVPGDGGAWLLPRVIGLARAAELLYTADTIDAKTALAWGLVSRVVPAADLMTEARALAERICRQPPQALRLTKKLLRQGLGQTFDDVMELSAALQALSHQTADHAEAVAAFFERRAPKFTGR